MKQIASLLLTALLLVATARAADETPLPAVALEKGGGVNGGNFVVGYRFTLTTPMTVCDLGVIDQNGDGKLKGTRPAKVALWNHEGKELVAAEVAQDAKPDQGAFYTHIEPLRLEPGSYVIGAAFEKDGENFWFDATIKSMPGMSWEEGRFETGAKFVYPVKTRAPRSSYFGPVFKVLASPEMAPASALSLRLEQPLERSVLQRDERGLAEVPVAGTFATGQADAVEVRAFNRQAQQTAGDWTAVVANPTAGTFRASLSLPAGWYQLEFRAKRQGVVVATGAVERVGVGELFVTCGQSNSANHGQPPQKASDDRVSTCDFQTGRWTHADDPQPGASGNGGSPWPLLGDQLAKKLEVPIGFICVGVGGTPVSFWTPTGKGYPRLSKALKLTGPQGVRAVLWHQGESDSIAGTSAENYARMLEQCIAQSRKDAGWDVPWGVALASFHPDAKATAERQAAVVAGQTKVIADVRGVFQGPETNSFHKRGLLADSVHFNATGLAAHAQGWAAALDPLFRNISSKPVKEKATKP